MSDGAFSGHIGTVEGAGPDSSMKNQIDVGSMSLPEAKTKCVSLGEACAGFYFYRGAMKHADLLDDETSVFEVYFVKEWKPSDEINTQFSMFKKLYRGIIVEIERCADCDGHTWCTRHETQKYDKYEDTLKNELGSKALRHQLHVNPGPHTRGVKCRKAYETSDVLYTTMVMDENTRKWSPEAIFRYPRIGAFEVSLLKAGHARVEVFSKLTVRKWPNPEWLANRIEEMVQSRLGGWEDSPIPEKQKKTFKTKQMTDEDLRNMMKTKFKTIMTAFRSFDKNGDGAVNKSEFMRGVKGSGLDLPKDQLERLWRMADEDNSGVLIYTEFARKFAAYKATGSLHRHGTIVNANVVKVHGMGAAQSVQKESAIRGASQNITFGVTGNDLKDPNDPEDDGPMTISKMSKDPSLDKIPMLEMTADQVRAKIYKKYGNLINAFRHFDQSGDSQVSHEEFCKTMPKVLGETVPDTKLNEWWNQMDTDLTGYIDMHELSSNQVCDNTTRGAKIFKGQATMHN
eukprot:gnl/MRDRNA2_/MRDRNA2_93814_c0_seq1.p1 gnl/MRDRNA2_/MRDRNA2_93814_c0~~gnl/MRDRNA2_/MRDRNA2_93814_c0_seq1.p1  ORF type:complete len:513 (+),score=84.59 gnl/MRDRNA2_/MRDRNA2_93814_c0_seq1:187-1725(+)